MLKLVLLVLLKFSVTSSLVLDPRFSVKSRQFNRDSRIWFDSSGFYPTVNYRFDKDFNEDETDYIREQFKKITSKTCVKVVEYSQDKQCDRYTSCVQFHKKSEPNSCSTDPWSFEINLSDHCFYDKWVLHEILHVLGFGHEHQRSDRNCYVEVTGSGLTDPKFRIDGNIDISFPYDVHSIMHYRMDERLREPSFTRGQHTEFGSKDELTEMDTIALNYMYCGGRHYCDINPERCQYFRCWIECNPCSDEPISQCKNCTGNIYW